MTKARTWPEVVSRIRQQPRPDVDFIAYELGLVRERQESDDELAERCHFKIDELMRDHAEHIEDETTLAFLDLHDIVADVSDEGTGPRN